MPLVCINGHQWEAGATKQLVDANSAVIEAHSLRCPICRLPAVDVKSDSHLADKMLGATIEITNAADSKTEAKTANEPARSSARPALQGYEILAVLGGGGMGLVYLARDVRLNRQVAIKMIRKDEHTEQDLRRFQIEAEAIAQLRHPHIVQIYGFGETNGEPYLCLEFVGGGNLATRIQAEPLSFRAAAMLGKQLAEAVDFAHQHGIVHRDLKPANVLLTTDGEPKITDFGLAKQLNADSDLTQTGALVGTPRYMSPEQAAGEFRALSAASDIFSLGAIFYEMLTGAAPFRAASVFDLLVQIRYGEPIRPSRLAAKLPIDLETICLRALEKEPRRRYPSAGEMAADLHRFLNNEPIRARPVGPVERSAKWVRRRPALAGMMAASTLAVTLVIGLGISRHYGNKLSLAYDDVERRRGEAEQFRSEAERQRALAHRYLYFAHMGQAHRAYREAQLVRMEDLLAQHDKDMELHGFEWRLLQRLRTQGWRKLTAFANEPGSVAFDATGSFLAAIGRGGRLEIWNLVRNRKELSHTYNFDLASVAFDPNGRRIAVGSWNGTIRIIDAATGVEQFALTGHKQGPAVAFAPDGRMLASCGVGSLRIWDLQTRSALRVVEIAIADSVQFDAKGERLLAATRDRRLKLIQVATGKVIREFASPSRTMAGATFLDNDQFVASSAVDGNLRIWRTDDGVLQTSVRESDNCGTIAALRNGKIIATGGWSGGVFLWDAAGNLIRMLGSHRAKVNSLAFGADGKTLASSSFDGTVRIWNLDESRERFDVRDEAYAVYGLAFLPKGNRLAIAGYNSKESAIRIWDCDRNKEQLRIVNADPVAEAIHIAIGPDNQTVAAGGFDCIVRLWESTTGKNLGTTTAHAGDVTRVAFRPDGKRFATGSGDKTVRVWDTATRKELACLRRHAHWIKGLAFSANGKWLASGCHRGLICLWDAETHQLLASWNCAHREVASLAFSPDSTHLTSVGSDGASVWRLEPIPTESRPPTLDFKLIGHNGPIVALSYSPRGDRIATTGWDRSVKIWDAETGQEILSLTGLANTGVDVAFAPNDNRLAVADGTQTVQIWTGINAQPDRNQGIAPPRQSEAPKDGGGSP